MIKRIAILFLIGMLNCVNSKAQNIDTNKLDSLFSILSLKNLMMGSIAITKDNKIVYKKSFGYKYIDGDKKIPADDNTKYRAGSVTKLFTSVMIFQLVEEGKLSLAEKLSTFFPQIKNAEKITIEDMMRHRSGIHDINNDSTYQDRFFETKSSTEVLEILASCPSDFEPNTKEAYSNSNFILLGCIVEKLDKNNYEKSLQQRVVEKLQLKNTSGFKPTKALVDMSLPYRFVDNSWVSNDVAEQIIQKDAKAIGGAGSIISTPTDLDVFINALFVHKLINKNNLERMMLLKDYYGMDMYKIPFREKFLWGHNGEIAIAGFTYHADLYHNIENNLSVAVCYNGINYNTNDVLIGILSYCFDVPFDLSSLKDATLLNQYIGTYSSKTVPLKIKIFIEKSQLYARATGQSAFPLSEVSENEFVFSPTGVNIQFDTEKKTFVLKQNGAEYLYTKE